MLDNQQTSGSCRRDPPMMPSFARVSRKIAVLLLAAMAVAGCSSGLFGGSKKEAPSIIDPNPFPANYRSQVLTLLRTTLTERAEYVGALIAPPALKQLR